MLSFVGDVTVSVTYVLQDDNGLRITMKGIASQPTPLNLANHVYFNLGTFICFPSMLKIIITTIAGHDQGAKGLGQHLVCMNADHYLPTSPQQIPLGNLADVGGTVFDLRVSKLLSDQLPNCPGGENNGYDHNFCVNGQNNLFRYVRPLFNLFAL